MRNFLILIQLLTVKKLHQKFKSNTRCSEFNCKSLHLYISFRTFDDDNELITYKCRIKLYIRSPFVMFLSKRYPTIITAECRELQIFWVTHGLMEKISQEFHSALTSVYFHDQNSHGRMFTVTLRRMKPLM